MSPLENHDSNPSPTSDAEGQVEGTNTNEAECWKRLYMHEKHCNNQAEKAKKRTGATMSLQRRGRIIPKMVSLFVHVVDINYQAKQHQLYMAGRIGDDNLEANDEAELAHIKKQNARSYNTYLQLICFVPNLEKELEEGDLKRADEIFSQLHSGCLAARSDDVSKMCNAVTDWLNKAYPDEKTLDLETREGHGIEHNITGWLLCPISYDWRKDETICQKLHAQELGYNFTANFCVHALYKNHRSSMTMPDKGFLQSTLLVKVVKQYVTSPDSAKLLNVEANDDSSDDENIPPPPKAHRTNGGRKKKTNNKSVSGIHNVTKVTLRLIAYSATMLLLTLSSANEWCHEHAGLNFEHFYYCIIDFFEAPPTEAKRKQRHEPLKWWNQQVFPLSSTATSSTAAKDTMALLNGA